jgi:hypothetical protein
LLENERIIANIPFERLQDLVSCGGTDVLRKLLDQECFITSLNTEHIDYLLTINESMVMEKLRYYIDRDSFISGMSNTYLEFLINLGDEQIMCTIANQIDEYAYEFNVCEIEWLCKILLKQKNYKVNLALAENGYTPERILVNFTKDANNEISARARETIQEMNEIYEDKT